jgi:hypothetical protein
MLKFQRKNVIETDTNTEDSDCDRRAAASKPEVMKMMGSRNPMVRMVVFGRMKKMVKNYQLGELPHLDKRLIRGLYDKRLKDRYEISNDLKGKSLLDRIVGANIEGATGIEVERQGSILNPPLSPYKSRERDHNKRSFLKVPMAHDANLDVYKHAGIFDQRTDNRRKTETSQSIFNTSSNNLIIEDLLKNLQEDEPVKHSRHQVNSSSNTMANELDLPGETGVYGLPSHSRNPLSTNPLSKSVQAPFPAARFNTSIMGIV